RVRLLPGPVGGWLRRRLRVQLLDRVVGRQQAGHHGLERAEVLVTQVHPVPAGNRREVVFAGRTDNHAGPPWGQSASSDSRSASSGRSIRHDEGMANVTELRVALTVENFDQAVAFYRDALGLEQIADWSSATGRVVVLEAGRATLELFDSAQAESVDAIEAG